MGSMAESNAPDIPTDYSESLKARGFRLEARIGGGLSGSVYRAAQASLDRPVAVKFCDSADASRSPALRARFEREARLLAAAQHPSIPYVITSGKTAGGVPYTIMQFIEGESLRRVLERGGKLDPLNAVRCVTDILHAIRAAHCRGIIHRDVKPDNVIVTS